MNLPGGFGICVFFVVLTFNVMQMIQEKQANNKCKAAFSRTLGPKWSHMRRFNQRFPWLFSAPPLLRVIATCELWTKLGGRWPLVSKVGWVLHWDLPIEETVPDKPLWWNLCGREQTQAYGNLAKYVWVCWPLLPYLFLTVLSIWWELITCSNKFYKVHIMTSHVQGGARPAAHCKGKSMQFFCNFGPQRGVVRPPISIVTTCVVYSWGIPWFCFDQGHT